MCRFEKQDGVVLMATTRNLKQIDEALQRPGRMDRVFHLQRPTQSEREKILQIAAMGSMDEELIDYVDWKKVICIHSSFVCNMVSVCTEVKYDANELYGRVLLIMKAMKLVYCLLMIFADSRHTF